MKIKISKNKVYSIAAFLVVVIIAISFLSQTRPKADQSLGIRSIIEKHDPTIPPQNLINQIGQQPIPDPETPTPAIPTPNPSPGDLLQITPIPTSKMIYSKVSHSTEAINLSGDDVLEIADAQFTHKNDIRLQDNAQLIIRDSLFSIEKEYAYQYNIFVSDNAKVIIENATLSNTCNGIINWSFYGSSTLKISNTQISGCNFTFSLEEGAIGEIDKYQFQGKVCDFANLNIKRSDNLDLELCYSSGVTVDEALPSDIDEFDFPNNNDKFIHSHLRITDSTINSWGVVLTPSSNITIRDTPEVKIEIFIGLPWANKTIELEDLRNKLYEDQTWEIVDSRLRLINTKTTGWEPNVFADSNTLIIKNSNFTGSTRNSDHAKYIVEDSVIGQLISHQYVEMLITNSIIAGDVIANDNSQITLVNSKVQTPTNASRLSSVLASDKATVTLENSTVDGNILEEKKGRVIMN